MFFLLLAGEFNTEFSTETLKWSEENDQTFSEGGLVLRNNKIIIPKRGLYFVYSQVSFRVNCQVSREESEHEGETVFLHHSVNRESNLFDNERPLLKASRSSCKRVVSEDSGEGWYSTINLGAVFSLEEGDKLSTDTSPLENVEGDSGKTFFGVFAL